VVLCSISSFSFWVVFINAGGSNSNPLVFLPRGQVALMQWVDANIPSGAVVLTTLASGTALPSFADVCTFVGHGPETPFYQAKDADAARYYRGELSLTELQALYDGPTSPKGIAPLYPVGYVVYTPTERALNNGADLPWADSLTLLYDQDGYAVYAVPQAGAAPSACLG
jgi:hypothetical protein